MIILREPITVDQKSRSCCAKNKHLTFALKNIAKQTTTTTTAKRIQWCAEVRIDIKTIEKIIRVCVRIFRISQNIFFSRPWIKKKNPQKKISRTLYLESCAHVHTYTHTHTHVRNKTSNRTFCAFSAAHYMLSLIAGFSYLFWRLQAADAAAGSYMYIAQRLNACLRLCMNLTHARRSTH